MKALGFCSKDSVCLSVTHRSSTYLTIQARKELTDRKNLLFLMITSSTHIRQILSKCDCLFEIFCEPDLFSFTHQILVNRVDFLLKLFQCCIFHWIKNDIVWFWCFHNNLSSIYQQSFTY